MNYRPGDEFRTNSPWCEEPDEQVWDEEFAPQEPPQED